jgi:hypothetical protein
MAQQEVIRNREQFQRQLQQTASAEAVPLEQFSWRDVANNDASELIVKSGGKERVFTITDPDLVNDVDGQIELIINWAIDNE